MFFKNIDAWKFKKQHFGTVFEVYKHVVKHKKKIIQTKIKFIN